MNIFLIVVLTLVGLVVLFLGFIVLTAGFIRRDLRYDK